MCKQTTILKTKLRTVNNLLTGRYNTNLKPTFLRARANKVQSQLNNLTSSKAASSNVN